MANLTGTWLGTYWQDGIPTRFEMSIAQGGNALNGNLGEATIAGEVIGRNVHFSTARSLILKRGEVIKSYGA
jgi:hypothetical protein